MMLKSLSILMFLIIGVQCTPATRRLWRTGIVSNLGKNRAKNDSHIPPNGYIAYGHQALVGEFPWMTYIETKKNDGRNLVSACGGSLISDRHVITAAHCLETARYLQDVTIIVGEYDKKTFPEDCDINNRCTTNIGAHPVRVISHQNYDPGNNHANDIAMLTLAADVNTAYIPPINLPPFDVDHPRHENAPLTVAGWGRTENSGSNLPNILRATEVNLKTRQQCYNIYNYRYPEGHLCAGNPNTPTSSCKGDSGGPLMMYYQNKFHISGIVSFHWDGQECGTHKANYYTNVFKYMQWIKWAIKQ